MKKTSTSIVSLLFVILTVAFSCLTANAQYNKTVAKDGTGDYTTVQAAIDAAPTNLTTPYKIFIKNGRYKEKINVPSNKPFLQFIGESVANTILTYDDYSGKAIPGGGTYGTSTSASVTINATDFVAINITFENTTGESPQALAINVNGDRAAFRNCRFLGGQDTVLTNTNGLRNYFRNCYIDGTVDFIFGGARAVFDSCIIYPKTRSSAGNSYITAANTQSTEAYGYVFRSCKIMANRGTTVYYLGRPWQNDAATAAAAKSRNKVAYLNTKMSSSVRVDGWSTWDAGTDTTLITYAEYKSQKLDGSLLDISQRVTWSKQLSDADALNYSNTNLFSTWDPCTVSTDFCTYQQDPIAVSNFAGTKGATNSVFNWNISWPITGIKYELFRSSDRLAFSKINEQTSTTDTAVNFTYSEAIPPPGQTYYYYILASKSSYASHTTDTVAISSTPTITTSGSLGSYIQGLGTPSNYQNITVSGVNLTNDLVITAPANYEISSNGGTSWNTSSTSINLPQTSGNVAATTISIRLNGTAVGTYSGNVTLISTGASQVNVAVTGTVQADPLLVSSLLQYWPMSTNNQDSSAARATGVTASTPVFNKLLVSDGTTVPAVSAYSVTYGQAYGATTAGLWTTAGGGPGGTLSRVFYQQFTVTAAANATLRIDSVILNNSFYNTSSNTKLAIVYSKTGFTTADSVDLIGASFASPIALTNETAGTTVNYRLAFNGATGITLSAGQTLSFRIYNSCGSGSAGRYGKLKNVYVLGNSNVTLPLTLQSYAAFLNTDRVNIAWATSNEINTSSFEIERSNDATIFSAIGSVNANNTSVANAYTFVDLSPLDGLTYYRLKMINKDGTYTYSKIVTVSKQVVARVSTYPNPVTNTLNVVHPKAISNSIISIFSTEGKLLLTKQIAVGETQSFINIGSFKNGNYLLLFNNDNSHLMIKFIKE